MMGGLVGRYEPGGDVEEYGLAEPDEVLNRCGTLRRNAAVPCYFWQLLYETIRPCTFFFVLFPCTHQAQLAWRTPQCPEQAMVTVLYASLPWSNPIRSNPAVKEDRTVQ